MRIKIYYNVKTDTFHLEDESFIVIVCEPGTEFTSYHLKQELKKHDEKHNYCNYYFYLEGELIKDKFKTKDNLKEAFEFAIVPCMVLHDMLIELNSESENSNIKD